MENEKRGLLNMLVANFLISLVPIIVYFANIETFPLSLGRFGFAALGIGVFYFWKDREKLKLKSGEHGMLLLISGVLHATTTLSFFFAISKTSPTFATLALTLGMLLYTGISYHIRHIEGTLFYLLMYIFLLAALLFSFNDLLASFDIWGIFSAIFSGFSMASVFAIGEYAKRYYDGIKITFYQNLIGFVVLFVVSAIFFSFPVFMGQDYVYLIILGILSTALPYILIYQSITKVTPILFSTLTILQILPALVFDLLYLNKTMDTKMIVGSMVIVVALYFGSFDFKKISNIKNTLLTRNKKTKNI